MIAEKFRRACSELVCEMETTLPELCDFIPDFVIERIRELADPNYRPAEIPENGESPETVSLILLFWCKYLSVTKERRDELLGEIDDHLTKDELNELAAFFRQLTDDSTQKKEALEKRCAQYAALAAQEDSEDD